MCIIRHRTSLRCTGHQSALAAITVVLLIARACSYYHTRSSRQFCAVYCTLITCVTLCYLLCSQVVLTESTLDCARLVNARTPDSSDAVTTALSLAGVSNISSKSDNSQHNSTSKLGDAAGRTDGILAIVCCKFGRIVTVVRVLPNTELVVPFEYTAECSADRDVVISDMA
jgi:hypothetical protein